MNADLVSEARKLLGVPYAHRGISKRGVDCIGFVALSLQNAGAMVPEFPAYGMWAQTGQITTTLHNYAIEVQPEQLEPGDIMLFKIGGVEQHLALFCEGGNMIHVLAMAGGNRGNVVEHAITVSWWERLVSCWRWKEDQWHQ